MVLVRGGRSRERGEHEPGSFESGISKQQGTGKVKRIRRCEGGSEETVRVKIRCVNRGDAIVGAAGGKSCSVQVKNIEDEITPTCQESYKD